MPISISARVQKKLTEKHHVSEREIHQCFVNLEGEYLRDPREPHETTPPTYWFISETNQRRKLKVVFIPRKIETEDGQKVRIEIKTAFPPDEIEIALYEKHGKC